MKIIYLFLTINFLLISSYKGKAQCFDFYRQTPKGTNVKACTGGGYSSFQVQQADAYSRTYAIEVLEAGTDSFNCHTYAWHVSESGDKVWMNNIGNETHNIDTYWNDQSYYQVNFIPGNANVKVFYGSTTSASDHSAITTSDFNIFISKMGCGCLVKHYKNSSPYDNSNLTYYKYNNLYISGTSEVCTSNSTFTLSNVPAEFTVDWECSNNMEIVTENSSTCTVRANGNGVGLVQAEISSGGYDPITISKDVWVGLKASFQGPSSVSYNGMGTWTADASCGFEPYVYKWWLREDNTGVASRLVSNSNPLVLYSFPRSFAILNDVETRQPTTNTTYYLQLEVIDDNLNQYYTPEQKIVAYGDVDLISRDLFLVKNTEKDSKISENLILRISPNPANEYINIQMDNGVNENRQSGGDDNKVYVRLYNNSMPVIDKVFYSENFTINTSNLQQGIYQLQVIYKGKKQSIQILVQH
jgi:hypothetical protein